MGKDTQNGSAGSTASKHILEIEDLVVQYRTREGVVEAVNGVSLSISKGEILGLVGETGAGKTTIALSAIGLLPSPVSHVPHGSVRLLGQELIGMPEKQLQKIRGKQVSMIFQDPMTALNPTMVVGEQIAEAIHVHNKCSKLEAEQRAMEMLTLVGIRPERHKDYPHQFSGGMKQRVVIAMALACNPALLIADEPTTALDVTIQAQILEIIKDLSTKTDTAVLMITHDLGIVAETCHKCAVVYAGEIVEFGTVHHIFDNPSHPYTKGLFKSIPNLDEDVERLEPIPGMMPDPMSLKPCCSFAERCSFACARCKESVPPKVEVEPEHFVQCFLAKQEGR